MDLVVLVEEPSMKVLLEKILPKIVPEDVVVRIYAHEGKSDLRNSLPKKLRAWKNPDVRFIVVQDQDANDCKELKADLKGLCSENTKKPFLVRIVCHELESWYFGDLKAVSEAYGKKLTRYERKGIYRDPDKIVNPKEKLKKLVPDLTQVLGAQQIGPLMNVNENRSKSFQVFVDGVRRLCQGA